MIETIETRSTRDLGVERRYFEVAEVRVEKPADGKGMPKITGYAAVFNQLSKPIPTPAGTFREKILPGAFAESLRSEADIVALVEHDPKQILARRSAGTLELHEDDHGLAFTINVADTNLGRDTIHDIEHGNRRGMSFGFMKPEDRWDKENGDVVRTLVKAPLKEITVTGFPVYPQTEIDLRSAIAQISKLNPPAGKEGKEGRATIEYDDPSLSYLCRQGIQEFREAFDWAQNIIDCASRVTGNLTEQDQQALDDCVSTLVDLIAKAKKCRAVLEAMGADDTTAADADAPAGEAAEPRSNPETSQAAARSAPPVADDPLVGLLLLQKRAESGLPSGLKKA